jgi:hypothetical protein
MGSSDVLYALWPSAVASHLYAHTKHMLPSLTQGLHKLLGTLPIALPLAMGHQAARAASDQLQQTLSMQDAMRLEKLYKIVSDDDATTSSLDVVLGPCTDQ